MSQAFGITQWAASPPHPRGRIANAGTGHRWPVQRRFECESNAGREYAFFCSFALIPVGPDWWDSPLVTKLVTLYLPGAPVRTQGLVSSGTRDSVWLPQSGWLVYLFPRISSASYGTRHQLLRGRQWSSSASLDINARTYYTCLFVPVFSHKCGESSSSRLPTWCSLFPLDPAPTCGLPPCMNLW
jgi:hypothetical protein